MPFEDINRLVTMKKQLMDAFNNLNKVQSDIFNPKNKEESNSRELRMDIDKTEYGVQAANAMANVANCILTIQQRINNR